MLRDEFLLYPQRNSDVLRTRLLLTNLNVQPHTWASSGN